jgi:mono/diheme cytochrome c family protein
MLLVGWVAINEPVRMDIFTQQWLGRSIEKGAEIFHNNCSICHGGDAKGIAGTAPALKNPMLFLKVNPARKASEDVAAITKQQDDLKKSLDTYTKNLAARADLQKKLDATAAGSDARKTLQAEIDKLEAQIRNFDPKTQEKIDALTPQIVEAQTKLAAYTDQGWDPKRPTRLEEMAWGGSLADYIRSTLISGRPASIFYWPRAMPAWGQAAGGPMREDQIENLVHYISNYEAEALRLTPKDINQEFKIPGGGAAASNKQVLGTSVDVTTLDLAGGDSVAGKDKYTALGCFGCHGVPNGASYPFAPTAGTWTRVNNIRLKVPEVADKYKTPEQYVAASILHPNDYIVPNGTAGVMPQNFGDQIDLKDLKDLIAYLATTK